MYDCMKNVCVCVHVYVNGSMIYFRRDCEVMSGELHKAGVAALCYHAGLSDGERCSVQQRWVREDNCKVGALQTPFI